MKMEVTMIAAGLLGLMLLFLCGYVIAGRSSFKIGIGDGGNPIMHRRIRAQANFVEYVPMALILIALIEYGAIGPHWLVAALGGGLVVARALHAQGLIASGGATFGRFVGTSLTMLVVLVGAVACAGRGFAAW
jgi:uncharacterized membrane protein YecN with MAPEG domain